MKTKTTRRTTLLALFTAMLLAIPVLAFGPAPKTAKAVGNPGDWVSGGVVINGVEERYSADGSVIGTVDLTGFDLTQGVYMVLYLGNEAGGVNFVGGAQFRLGDAGGRDFLALLNAGANEIMFHHQGTNAGAVPNFVVTKANYYLLKIQQAGGINTPVTVTYDGQSVTSSDSYNLSSISASGANNGVPAFNAALSAVSQQDIWSNPQSGDWVKDGLIVNGFKTIGDNNTFGIVDLTAFDLEEGIYLPFYLANYGGFSYFASGSQFRLDDANGNMFLVLLQNGAGDIDFLDTYSSSPGISASKWNHFLLFIKQNPNGSIAISYGGQSMTIGAGLDLSEIKAYCYSSAYVASFYPILPADATGWYLGGDITGQTIEYAANGVAGRKQIALATTTAYDLEKGFYLNFTLGSEQGGLSNFGPNAYLELYNGGENFLFLGAGGSAGITEVYGAGLPGGSLSLQIQNNYTFKFIDNGNGTTTLVCTSAYETKSGVLNTDISGMTSLGLAANLNNSAPDTKFTLGLLDTADLYKRDAVNEASNLSELLTALAACGIDLSTYNALTSKTAVDTALTTGMIGKNFVSLSAIVTAFDDIMITEYIRILNAINLGTLINITEDLTLPSAANGLSVAWASSNTSVITNAGVVTRPASGQSNASVNMTATIGGESKVFAVTVAAFGAPTIVYEGGTIVVVEGMGLDETNDYILTSAIDGLSFELIPDGQTSGSIVTLLASMINYNKATAVVGDGQVFTVTHGGTTAAITIDVVAKSVVEIEVKTGTTWADVLLGGTLNLIDRYITATYNNDTSADVAIISSMLSGFDSETPGSKTVTVTYLGEQTTFAVTVTDRAATNFTIIYPAKIVYNIGEAIDLTGCKITVSFDNGTTATIDVTSAMIAGFDSSEAGTVTVTITYQGISKNFDVTVEVVGGDGGNDGGCGSFGAEYMALFALAGAALFLAKKKS
ncbi:MAG: bacterial Ig-like domain-containing protein [Firmicutes bacterium]|nr:bacterial Ig-like domain-containing protein [Bacillota bacterium]